MRERRATGRPRYLTVRVFLLAFLLAVPLTGRGHAAPGDPDLAFGGDGLVAVDVETSDTAGGMVVTRDGGVLLACGCSPGGMASPDFCVARLTAGGALDPAFGAGGIVQTDILGGFDVVNALATDANGSVLAAGYSNDGPGAGAVRWTVARYLPGGTLDPTFGAGGVVRLATSPTGSVARVRVQPDGRIVLTGNLGSAFAVARLDASGGLDPTFGSGGIASPGVAVSGGADLALQADGRIVGVGRHGSDFGVVRLLSDGQLDPSFGAGGLASCDFMGGVDEPAAIAIQPDGGIVVAGRAALSPGLAPPSDLAIARFRPDGTLDPSFNGSGKLHLDLGSTNEGVHTVVLRPEGGIVVAGKQSFPDRVVLASLTMGGLLDPEFATGGILIETRPGAPTGYPGLSVDLALSPDGALTLAASAPGTGAGNFDLGVARYERYPHTVDEVAGTGVCSLVYPGLTGSIVFDDQDRSVAGTVVNLGSAVGTWPYSASVSLATTPVHLSVTGASAALSLAAAGAYNFGTGEAVLLASSVSGTALPAGPRYRLEATLLLGGYTPDQVVLSGPCRLIAQTPANTPVGSDVVVDVEGFSLRFAQVTAPGVTSVAPLASTVPGLPGQLRAEFEIARSGPVAVQFEFSTTASYVPPIQICGALYLSMDEIDETSVHVLHYETVAGVGSWVDLPLSTTWLESGLLEICAELASFSPVVVAFSGPDTDGFVPDSKEAASCSGRLNAAAARLAAGLLRCHEKAARAAISATGFDGDLCETQARARYDARAARLTGCASCSVANVDALAATTAHQVDASSGAFYCEGSSILRPTVYGRVPPDATSERCESRFAAAGEKLWATIAGCNAKEAKALLAGRTFDAAACEARGRSRASATLSRLTGCPACASAAFTPAMERVERVVDQEVNELAYCAGTTRLP